MLHLSSEDTASIGVVLAVLDHEARALGSSKMAGVWRDWAALLRPTADEARRDQEAPPHLAA